MISLPQVIRKKAAVVVEELDVIRARGQLKEMLQLLALEAADVAA